MTATRIKLFLLLITCASAITPTRCQCDFGNINPGYTVTANFVPNILLGVPFTLSTPMRVTALHIWGENTGSDFQMALYQDSAGIPTHLITYSGVGVVDSGDIAMSVPPAYLVPGDYWIMAVYQDMGHHCKSDFSASKTVYHDTYSLGSPMPQYIAGFQNYCCQDFHYWATGGPYETDSIEACDSLTWSNGVTYYTNTDSVVQILPNGSVFGCDSTVFLNLTIKTIDTSLTVMDPVISVNIAADAYQWLDCNDNMNPIPGATSQTFVPDSNGVYAVAISNYGCVDTSACTSIQTVGIRDLSDVPVSLFPNPTTDNFMVRSNTEMIESVDVFSSDGKLILTKTGNAHDMNISLEEFETGVYLVVVHGTKNVSSQILVKE